MLFNSYYASVQKFSKIFFKELLPKTAFIKQKQLLQNIKITALYVNIFENVIYSCDGKAEFSVANTPVFSVT